jgi:hemin uptake protein HemP
MKPDERPLPNDKQLRGLPARVDVLRTPPPALSSQSLLQGQKAVAIEHNGELYRLQNTRTGKLILTK